MEMATTLWRTDQSGFKNVNMVQLLDQQASFEQLSGLMVLWIGAHWYSKGDDSGQLIAFRILASYVTSPC